ACKAVLYTEEISGERLVIMDVTVLEIKIGIPVVSDLQQTVFYAECVCIIFSYLMFGDFYRPIVQVFSIKQLDPFQFFRSFFGCACAGAGEIGRASCRDR